MFVIHIVGPQGSGKSTLARALTLLWQGERKRKCVTVDSEAMCIDFGGDPRRAAAATPSADVLILEHFPDRFGSTEPADLVIRLEGRWQ